MPNLSFKLSWIESLATLHNSGSFESAAELLGITQSAMSQRILSLEGSIGMPLVVRSRPIQLTPAGKVIAGYLDRFHALSHTVGIEMESLLQSGNHAD